MEKQSRTGWIPLGLLSLLFFTLSFLLQLNLKNMERILHLVLIKHHFCVLVLVICHCLPARIISHYHSVSSSLSLPLFFFLALTYHDDG